MTARTSIEWTHMPGYVGGVWNPTTGCTRVSDGCDNCYAFALHDKRFKANLDAARSQAPFPVHPNMTAGTLSQAARSGAAALPFPKQYDLPFSRVQLLEDRLDVPLRTRKPTCYFVDSMADLFHEDVPDAFLERVFGVMTFARQHRFLILTKRPERMRSFIPTLYATKPQENEDPGSPDWKPWPRSNIWLGTSVEDQKSADERIPHLLATPAAVRFLSCEPLLGPVDLTHWTQKPWMSVDQANDVRRRLSWVIVGGESGARARPMDLAWARSLLEQCKAAGVAAFVKQLGSKPWGRVPGMKSDYPQPIELRESHGRDMAEWPEDLRVREWPR